MIDSKRIDELVERTDPRNNPATGEFFRRLAPAVAERIAVSYRERARALFETAALIFAGLERFESRTGTKDRAARDAIHDALGEMFYSDANSIDDAEISADLVGLHFFEDDGIHIAIDSFILDVAREPLEADRPRNDDAKELTNA